MPMTHLGTLFLKVETMRLRPQTLHDQDIINGIYEPYRHPPG